MTARKSDHHKKSARDSARDSLPSIPHALSLAGRGSAGQICRTRVRKPRTSATARRCTLPRCSWVIMAGQRARNAWRGRRSHQVLEPRPRSQVRFRWTAKALRPFRVYGRIFRRARLSPSPFAAARIRGHGGPRLLECSNLNDSSLDILWKMLVGRLLAGPHNGDNVGVHSAFHDPRHS